MQRLDKKHASFEQDYAPLLAASLRSPRLSSGPASSINPGVPLMPALVHPKLRVAAVQAAPEFLDLDGSINKGISLMEKAAADGVRFIAFPETWIPGYPWWIWLAAPALGLVAGP